MTDRPDQLSRRLAVIADMGPALRAAGYASVEIDGDRVSLRLAPPYGPLDSPAGDADAKPAGDPDPKPEPEPDPLDDPATYEDGQVPGYTLDEDPA